MRAWRGDVVQVAYGYGVFTGGLGLNYGVEEIGTAVLPIGAGTTTRQISLMKDLGTTAIACTPSYLLHIGEVAGSMNIDIASQTRLRAGILGAEPWSLVSRKHRAEPWNQSLGHLRHLGDEWSPF